jgi:hypothetical protein
LGEIKKTGLKEDAQKPVFKTWTEVYLPDKFWRGYANRELTHSASQILPTNINAINMPIAIVHFIARKYLVNNEIL